MRKKILLLIISCAVASSGFATAAHATVVVNGAACADKGATTTVKVKGVNKIYACAINPIGAAGTPATWVLKNCLSYWNSALGQQSNIAQQQALVNVMTEPDKTRYTAQLKASQAALDKVKAAIKTNWCKAGL
jgi:hypothetical protein